MRLRTSSRKAGPDGRGGGGQRPGLDHRAQRVGGAGQPGRSDRGQAGQRDEQVGGEGDAEASGTAQGIVRAGSRTSSPNVATRA